MRAVFYSVLIIARLGISKLLGSHFLQDSHASCRPGIPSKSNQRRPEVRDLQLGLIMPHTSLAPSSVRKADAAI